MGLFDFLKPTKTAIEYFDGGIAKYGLQDYNGAKEDFSKAIELDSKYTIAYFNRGKINADLKYYYEARCDFDKVIELEPNNWNAYFNRGISSYEDDYYRGAFTDLSKVITNVPSNSEALVLFEKLKSILYSEKQKNLYLLEPEKYFARKFTDEEIEKEFDMTVSDIRVTPRFGTIVAVEKNIEAYDYYAKGLFEDGINSAKYAIRNNKYKQNILVEEIKGFEEYSSISKRNSIYLNTLSLGYLYVCDYDKALITSNKCIELDINENFETPENYTTRAKIFFKLENNEKSIIDLKKALGLDPNYEEAIKLMASLK